MVKKAGLISGLSLALGVPSSQVSLFYRDLSEARLISFTGGRGVNGPDLTYLDCARMVIAFLVTDRPSSAAQAVRDFGSMPMSGWGFFTEGQKDEIHAGKEGRTFENFLADHLEGLSGMSPDEAASQSLLTHIVVTPRRMECQVVFFTELATQRYFFSDPLNGRAEYREVRKRYEQRIEVVRSLVGISIAEIATIFRSRSNGE